MPKPGEHKTVQARILKYAQEIGWAMLSQKEAETRRVFDSRKAKGSSLPLAFRGFKGRLDPFALLGDELTHNDRAIIRCHTDLMPANNPASVACLFQN